MDSFIVQPMLNLLTLLVTALSSFFLIRSVITLSPSDVARMSGAHFTFNPKLGESFAVQKADTIVGFFLLMVSVILQAYNTMQPLRWIDTAGLNGDQVIVTFIIFFVVLILSEVVRRLLIKKYKRELDQGLGKYADKI